MNFIFIMIMTRIKITRYNTNGFFEKSLTNLKRVTLKKKKPIRTLEKKKFLNL